jgi:hypothetical protein
MKPGVRFSLRIVLLLASIATLTSWGWIERHTSPAVATTSIVLVLLSLSALQAHIPCVQCGQRDSVRTWATRRLLGFRGMLRAASGEGTCLWCRRRLETAEPPA